MIVVEWIYTYCTNCLPFLALKKRSVEANVKQGGIVILKLENINKCCGCSSCANSCHRLCIAMRFNSQGFVIPEINNENCIECGTCTRVCPLTHESKVQSSVTAFAAYTLDEDIRRNSSSGGLFSEIALWILEQKGAVFGAAYNDHFQIKHICAETVDDLYKMRGAKYAQSDLGICFTDILSRLKADQKVLF